MIFEIALINIIIMCIFMFCTNTQKVIDSIQSRCAIIKIKPTQKMF